MIEVAERPKVKEVPVDDLNRTIDCFAKQTYDIPPELMVLSHTGAEPELHFAELEGVARSLAIEAQAEDFGCFRILSQKDGDKRVVWCRRVVAQINAAKEMFMELLGKGMVPYRVGIDGRATSDVMREFDPLAEEVVFMPVRAISGG